MNYLSWNDAIGNWFFNPARGGSRVFLYMTTDMINEIGSSSHVNQDDFIIAVKTGPEWVHADRSICQQALEAYKDWRSRNLPYPPYLGYLALFSLAAWIEPPDGFARHSYYPGLRDLLGEEPQIGDYPSFKKMYELWFDLEIWTNEDKEEDWGIFRADIYGKREYIGLPKAQIVLTDDEREKLPLLFAECGFDPLSLPSDTELAYCLSHDNHSWLLPRTKIILKSTKEKDLREMLLETIFEELRDWDGAIPQLKELSETKSHAFGNLRLAMTIDSTALRVKLGFRCRSTCNYPEEGLKLSGEVTSGFLYCSEDSQGWSTLLTSDENQTELFDAATIDLRKEINLFDDAHSWKVIFSKRSVRIMMPASSCYGFDGFIEESQLPRGKFFYLLVKNDIADVLENWGQRYCDGFVQLENISGISSDWRIYRIERVLSDEGIKKICPYLSFSKRLSIQLQGGLKVKANQYFPLALPKVKVIGSYGDDVVVNCNDQKLYQDEVTGYYEIRHSSSVHKFTIEVKRGSDDWKRSFYTTDRLNWKDVESIIQLDKYGKPVYDDDEEFCVGNKVYGYVPPEFSFEVFLPPTKGIRTFFIGKNPGEIATVPLENLPENWSPVWAISMRQKGKAVFCGLDLGNSKPTEKQVNDKRRVKQWKKILWHKRKLIVPPDHPALRKLWIEYMKAAQHVL